MELDSPALGKGGAGGMRVEIPANNLHVMTMTRGSATSMDSNPATPSSASSALKTPTRVSPMTSPFNSDHRFPPNNPMVRLRDDLPSPHSTGSHTVVIVPARHADEPEYELPQHKSISSNGSASELPSFHQQPFPADGDVPPHFGYRPPSHPSSASGMPPSPSLWRGQPYGLPDSADIERELLEGRRMSDRSSGSDEEEIDVVDSDRRGPHYAFSPPLPQQVTPAQHNNPASPVSPHSPSPSFPVPAGVNNGSNKQGVLGSPKPTDLRAAMKSSGNRSRAERAPSSSSSTSSVASANSPKPLNLAWKKGDLIGRGGFGSVYKGLLSNGQSVAVKVLELPPDVDPTKSSTHASFMKEIDMLKALKHPNIVRYIGSTVEAHTINVFLEYVPGGSIASMVSKYGPFDEHMIKLFARHILQALSYLHHNNIAHRDVKGANILVDTQGVAKLADFGCSKSISVKSSGPGENFQTMLGTPYWMAPEVMRQEGHGRMADIWSFGCTLVEMASGKPPWAKDYTQVRNRPLYMLSPLSTPITTTNTLATLASDLNSAHNGASCND